MDDSPLAGVRVLDLSRVLSGPFAGRLLADLGADVVKLEPPEGDVTRLWGDVRHGLSGFYTQQNVGKRNVCVDLKAPGGADLALRLATVADVVVENFRPGVLARLGLGWEALSAANPRLVLLSISGFGQTGPYANRQAYAPVIHAESGLMARQAERDGTFPADPMYSIADTVSGLHGLVGVLAALVQRARTGRGQHVDVAMLDVVVATDDYAHYVLDGVPFEHLAGEVWEAPGGPILIASELRHVWRQVSTAHGLADPTPPGAGLEEKIRARHEAVAAWVKGFPDREALYQALREARLAWGDVLDPADALASPSLAHRGALAEVDDRGGGRRRVVQSPYRFSDARSGAGAGGAPYRGEHNNAVLAEWLGAGPDEVAGLAAAGVLSAEEPPGA